MTTEHHCAEGGQDICDDVEHGRATRVDAATRHKCPTERMAENGQDVQSDVITCSAGGSVSTRDVLVSMFDMDCGIENQAAVVKITYLIKALYPNFDIPEFKQRQFGPNSPGVCDELWNLVSADVILHESVPNGAYQFRLSDRGREMAAIARVQNPEAYNAIRAITDKCMDICHGNGLILSFAAAIHHKYTRSGAMTERAAVIFGVDLEWGIAETEMLDALRLLRAIGLNPLTIVGL